MALATVFAVFVIALSGVSSYASSKDDNVFLPIASDECYYTSMTVTAGESLWTISGDYSSYGFSSQMDYINEIKRINNLKNDVIHAGESLIVMDSVPAYSCNASVR